MSKTALMIANSTTRAKLACCILLAVWASTFWTEIGTIVQAYKGTGFDYHGFLVLPLSIWLIQQQASLLKRSQYSYSAYGILAILLCSVLWIFARISELQSLEQIALISFLPAIILTSWGTKVCKIILLPLLCLFLLLPFGSQIITELQSIFAWLLVESLAIFKLAVYWEAKQINIGEQNLDLSNLFSAFRYIGLGLVFGFAYAACLSKTFFKRVIIASCFLLLPIVALLFSIYTIIGLNTVFDLRLLTTTNFKVISWISFSLGICCAIALGYKFKTKQGIPQHGDSINWRGDYAKLKQNWLAPTLLSGLVIISMPFSTNFFKTQLHTASNWHDLDHLKPNSKKVTLAINYNNISNSTANYDSKIWQPIKTNYLQVKNNNKKIPITEFILKSKQKTRLLWNVNYTNRHLTRNQTYTIFLEKLYGLTPAGTKSASISLSIDVDSDIGQAREVLMSSVQNMQFKRG